MKYSIKWVNDGHDGSFALPLTVSLTAGLWLWTSTSNWVSLVLICACGTCTYSYRRVKEGTERDSAGAPEPLDGHSDG